MTDTKITQPGTTPPVIIVNVAARMYSHDRSGQKPPAGYSRSTRGQRAVALKGYRYDPFAWDGAQ